MVFAKFVKNIVLQSRQELIVIIAGAWINERCVFLRINTGLLKDFRQRVRAYFRPAAFLDAVFFEILRVILEMGGKA